MSPLSSRARESRQHSHVAVIGHFTAIPARRSSFVSCKVVHETHHREMARAVTRTKTLELQRRLTLRQGYCISHRYEPRLVRFGIMSGKATNTVHAEYNPCVIVQCIELVHDSFFYSLGAYPKRERLNPVTFSPRMTRFVTTASTLGIVISFSCRAFFFLLTYARTLCESLPLEDSSCGLSTVSSSTYRASAILICRT